MWKRKGEVEPGKTLRFLAGQLSSRMEMQLSEHMKRSKVGRAAGGVLSTCTRLGDAALENLLVRGMDLTMRHVDIQARAKDRDVRGICKEMIIKPQ